jgi:hypothetical protein
MFVSAAATLPDLSPQPGPTAEATPSRFGRVISLVRRIIDYGKQLAASLEHPTPATDLDKVARTFGSYDFGQILASILRGLHRARELEAKLIRLDARPAPEPRPAAIPSPPKPRAAAAPTPSAEKPAPNPIRFATPEQIAKQVRSRPIGAVLTEICRDLGIHKGHPLWAELFDAIIRYDGALARLSRDFGLRPWLDPETRQPIASAGVPLFCRPSVYAKTGPPP